MQVKIEIFCKNLLTFIAGMLYLKWRYKMSEKQKAIYLEEWLIEAIQREADKHHRSWMREVQAILEEVIFDRQNIEKAESENK